MGSRSFVGGGAAVALSLALGFVLSLATTRVKNWFVMSDELYYERLAVSVAQTGSLVPRLHGEVVSNANQLYPVLLSTVYGDGNVPASFEAAHRLNAFVIASAAIPVYLLARRVGVATWRALAVGAVSVAVPWIVLSSFLLTEVVAYPAFCWALLALVHAVERKTWTADALALVAVAVAVLARTQFLVLLVVFPVAVALEAAVTAGVRSAPRELWRTRRPLVLLFAILVVVWLAAVAVGDASRLVGTYSVAAEHVRLDLELLQLVFEHVAALALGLAVLPFVVGVAWLIDRVRSSAAAPARALAVVGVTTLVLVTLEVASFNQRFGAGLVKERYLFYVVPIVLVGVAAAVASRAWPPWWALAVPAAVAAVGFVSMPVTRYEKLNVDTPVAILNDGLLDLATTETWARAMLVLAIAVVLQILLLARAFLAWKPVAAAAAVVAAVALPLETAYAFERLFRVNGTNGLPITLDQGVVFNWIDRYLGQGRRLAFVRYPFGGQDWSSGIAYWWDVEFWNESAVTPFGEMRPGATEWPTLFEPATGRVLDPPDAQYALFYVQDVRFHLAGPHLLFDRDAYLLEPERPWRASWLTSDIYPDGFTRPHTPATVTVFANPGQQQPLRRFATLRISSPDPHRARPVTVTTNLGKWSKEIAPGTSFEPLVSVCVPPRGRGTIVIETSHVSAVYSDPTQGPPAEGTRPAGVHIRSISVADETEPMERCPS